MLIVGRVIALIRSFDNILLGDNAWPFTVKIFVGWKFTYASNMNEFRVHQIIQSWNIELQRERDTVYLHLGVVSGDVSVGWPVTNYIHNNSV